VNLFSEVSSRNTKSYSSAKQHSFQKLEDLHLVFLALAISVALPVNIKLMKK